MKKIGLLCITALMGLSLAACGNSSSTKKSASSSSHSASKVVKKHHKQSSSSQKKSSSSSESIASSQQAQAQGQQVAQPAAQNTAPSTADQGSDLEQNARAQVGPDGLIHGRIYGSNGYWIDADASRQGLAQAGMPNSDSDILAHAYTGNAMWNASH